MLSNFFFAKFATYLVKRAKKQIHIIIYSAFLGSRPFLLQWRVAAGGEKSD